jgi:hypothetical protein
VDVTLTLDDGGECSLKYASADVETVATSQESYYKCSFGFESDGGAKNGSITLRLDYESNKQRFWFLKGEGPSIKVHLDGEQSRGLAEFLNMHQDIALIGLRGGEIVYQGRRFFKIDYSYAEEVLVNLIHPLSKTPACTTEKGTPAQIAAAKKSKATEFPERSLFRALAEEQIDLSFDTQVLICDDLGTEIADFVAANFDTQTLALIHAKAAKGFKISASAFHEVTAQAVKNLVYMTRNSEVPKGIGSWRRDGRWNETGIPRMYRLPASLPSGQTLWQRLKDDIIGTSNPELYVVLLTTGCCHVPTLKEAIRNPSKRTPEVAQLLYLLDGLNGLARQLGIRLVVFDVPYHKPTN